MKTYEEYTTGTGQQLEGVHQIDECWGEFCPIHNPSDHALVGHPTNWREDRRIMERICEHGVGHPDPDDQRVRADYTLGIHSCDGCCRG
jgi:hypothetical protein